MEDAATAEISRAQVWQWIHHSSGVLTDGRKVDVALVRRLMGEEMEKIRESVGEQAFSGGQYRQACKLFDDLSTSDQFTEFLTLKAYDHLA